MHVDRGRGGLHNPFKGSESSFHKSEIVRKPGSGRTS